MSANRSGPASVGTRGPQTTSCQAPENHTAVTAAGQAHISDGIALARSNKRNGLPTAVKQARRQLRRTRVQLKEEREFWPDEAVRPARSRKRVAELEGKVEKAAARVAELKDQDREVIATEAIDPATGHIDKLNDIERAEFKRLDGIVREHAGAFVAVGEALRRIRDGRLYREKHETFEAYARATHDIVASRARQICLAAETVDAIKSVTNCNVLPANEGQVRPLLKITDEKKRPEAWQAAVERANGSKLTARIVSKVVREMLGEETKRRPTLEVAADTPPPAIAEDATTASAAVRQFGVAMATLTAYADLLPGVTIPNDMPEGFGAELVKDLRRLARAVNLFRARVENELGERTRSP